MRVMAGIRIPVAAGNRALQDGTVAGVFQQVMERWQPEAMYFATFDGQRGAFVIFDLADASDLPSFAEPFFQGYEASVEIVPAMNVDDMQKALSAVGGPQPG